MKKEKAYRLDSILEVLVVNRYLTKTEIELKLEESVIYRDLLTIRSHNYKENKIIITKLENGHRIYKLTPEGAAFIEDEGFVELIKAESRARKITNIQLVLNIITTAVALTAIAISFLQIKSQNTQYFELEHRIKQIEKNIK